MIDVSNEPNNHYHHLAFGPDALNRQQRNGSYLAYGRHTERADDGPQRLDDRELLMIRRADQFCLATVTPNGWPYLQYRSGPAGFVRYLPETDRLRFIDLPGNNQFVTLGNLAADDRLPLDRAALEAAVADCSEEDIWLARLSIEEAKAGLR